MTWNPIRPCLIFACLLVLNLQVFAEPIPPATDEQIASMIEEAGDAEDYPGSDILCILDDVDVHVRDTGLATTNQTRVLKILTENGSRQATVQRYEFDPATNRVAYRSIKIHRKDGTIETVPVDGVLEQPARQHMIYWGNSQYILGLPKLYVGDSLEIRTERTGFNIAYLENGQSSGGVGHIEENIEEILIPPMPGHWYETTIFQTHDPIVLKRYAVHMPLDKPVQYETYNGELKSSVWFEENNQMVYTFWAKDIPPLKNEFRRVAPDDFATKLVMATIPDWYEKSRWFWQANKDQFEVTPAVKAKAEEITKGLTTRDEKMDALHHWVSDNIRYYGTSRGPTEGYTLHTGDETLRDRGGVCKDIAGMLITFFRAIGENSYPAMTMAGSRVERIPADQFNHTICCVREPDGTFTIWDPTWAPLSKERWSCREPLQHLVYGTEEGQDLTQSPYFPPEHSLLRIVADSTITEDGTLTSTIHIDTSGYPCTYLRRYVYRLRESQQKADFEQRLRIAPNVELQHLKYTHPMDYSQDSQVDMTISAADYTAGNGEAVLFKLPVMQHPLSSYFIPDLLYSLSEKERNEGYVIRATRLVQYEETIHLPDGWSIVETPKAKEMDSGSASLTFEIDPSGNTLKYNFEFSAKHMRIPAEDYADWRDSIESMNDITNAWILCKEKK